MYNEAEMVFVQGGTFTMGKNKDVFDTVFDSIFSLFNPVEERWLDNSEKPHQVTVNSFYIGKYPITQAQWKAIMGNNPAYFKGDNLPIEYISWNDTQEYINKLNRLTGKNYRLPTEAEWEYAARGGIKSRGYRYSGSNYLNEIAWYRDNSNDSPHPVGTKLPNELGIYDMSGNINEWCNDLYDEFYYYSSPQNNPKGPSSGWGRVFRGGSCHEPDICCHVALRRPLSPDEPYNCFGFRLALS